MIYLERSLSVLVSLVKFYVFVLDEIYVRGPKNVYEYIFIGNVQEKIHKDEPRFLKEGPNLWAEVVQTSLTYGRHRRLVGWLTPRRW